MKRQFVSARIRIETNEERVIVEEDNLVHYLELKYFSLEEK